ncbi:MAG TPA: hypothetical protein VFH28_01670 [Nitrososphaera sp.]|nr:hypothetical protein [Nitrososphaera sp.]
MIKIYTITTIVGNKTSATTIIAQLTMVPTIGLLLHIEQSTFSHVTDSLRAAIQK